MGSARREVFGSITKFVTSMIIAQDQLNDSEFVSLS
jgi:hypothetical protein